MAPQGASEPPKQDRWAQLSARFKSLPGAAKRLAKATPTWQRGRLVLQLPAGRALAEGRRVADRDDVLKAFRAAFPRAEGLSVVAAPGTRPASDREKARRERVMSDPQCRTIIERLGAQLERVVPLDDAESDAP